MKRTASAQWTGDLKTGKGTVSSQTGVLKDTRYGFASRFEDGPGTNPEELLGAAHAGCYSMMLSLTLGEKGLTADWIATTATVTLDTSTGAEITAVHLEVTAKVPGADAASFAAAAEAAKTGCPISKVLKAAITLTATLEA